MEVVPFSVVVVRAGGAVEVFPEAPTEVPVADVPLTLLAGTVAFWEPAVEGV